MCFLEAFFKKIWASKLIKSLIQQHSAVCKLELPHYFETLDMEKIWLDFKSIHIITIDWKERAVTIFKPNLV